MATTKHLDPTNVNISIPAMTDAPDASVFSNCVDKEADAINALNTNKMNIPKRFSVGGNGSKTFTIDNSSNIRITTFGNSGNMMSETLIYTHSSGVVRTSVVKEGSNVSIVSSGNNTITISSSNSADLYVLFEIFKGNVSEANA